MWIYVAFGGRHVFFQRLWFPIYAPFELSSWEHWVVPIPDTLPNHWFVEEHGLPWMNCQGPLDRVWSQHPTSQVSNWDLLRPKNPLKETCWRMLVEHTELNWVGWKGVNGALHVQEFNELILKRYSKHGVFGTFWDYRYSGCTVDGTDPKMSVFADLSI